MKRIITDNIRHFRYFYKELKYRIFVSMGLNFLVGLMDGFGLAMFLPLLKMADESSSTAQQELGQLSFLPEMIESLGFGLNLTVILVVMSLFFILKGLARFFGGAYNALVLEYHQRKLRLDLVSRLNRLAFDVFVRADVGRIQNSLTGEIGRISNAYSAYFEVIKQMVLVMVYLGFAVVINASFALFVIVGAVVTNLLYQSIYKKTKKASKNVTDLLNELQGYLIQLVHNYKYLKATGSQFRYGDMLKNTAVAAERENRRIGMFNAILIAVKEPILIIVVSIVILLQTSWLGQPLGPILVSLLFFYRSLSSLMVVQNHWNKFISRIGSLENMIDFEDFLESNSEQTGETDGGRLKGELKIQNLDFSYGDLQVLKNVNLTIDKNQTVAFVGESGSGKTTLVNIMAALMAVPPDSFLIDGTSASELDLQKYRSRIGYITQEPVVFNDTLFNNVTFWAEKNDENLRRFHESIEKAALNDFVDSLPLNEDTILGNNGVDLSGGQRQRVSIARELFKDIDILIMDEATSALDSETERFIQEHIDQLKGDYTILLVAHRLSTVKNADRIVLLNKGEVDCSGTFNELREKSEVFRRMVELQDFGN